MMEIHDELMTPGCPQCAIKHLSAALSYSAEVWADYKRNPGKIVCLIPSPGQVALARAYINLCEVLTGYKSHLWFAIGLLQRAEEDAIARGGPSALTAARPARLLLEEKGLDGVRNAVLHIYSKVCLEPLAMEFAHREEARRELPSFDFPDDYQEAIEKIRKEYFEFNEAPAASDGSAEEGGETDMTKKTAKLAAKAAVKAAAKKGGAKAVKAACKGGKTACKGTKAACKGGKCKDK